MDLKKRQARAQKLYSDLQNFIVCPLKQIQGERCYYMYPLK